MNALEVGARFLGWFDSGRTLLAQQIEVASTLDEHRAHTAILMPRRSTKTTTIFAWIVGMCLDNPGLQIAYTAATTGKSARDRFLKEIAPEVERAQEAGAPVRLRKGAGTERVIFDNGSLFQVLAPLGNEFRGQAFDVVVVDEAGEAGTAEGGELLAAILPTLITSELGMLVVTGTAGDYREGNLLWDSLVAGEQGDAAMVDYSLGDAVELDRLKDWDYVAPLLERHHPSVPALISLDAMKLSWRMMGADLFAREYLGLWGDLGGAGGLFSTDAWANLYIPGDIPALPKRFALAVAATEDTASIVAAWRVEGEGRLVLLEHRKGRSWVPLIAREISRKHRVPIVVDPKASMVMADVKQRLEQIRPAPQIVEQTFEDVAAAHERMVEDVREQRIRHFGQDPLTDAFLKVTRKQMGNRWKYGRMSEEDDITPAQAATLALRYFDSMARTARGTLQAVAV